VLAESIRQAVLQQLAGDRVSRQGLSFLMDRARAWLPAGAQAKLMRWLERRGLRRYVSLDRSRARYDYLRARFEQAAAVTAPSRFLIEQFRAAGFDSRPIEYIDYGIPIPQSAARLPASARRPLRCGYLSTVVPFKGIEVALEAFRGIDPSQAELWVRAPGYPPYVAEVRHRAADLPHVHFLGPYGQDQVGAVFQDLDVLLVPSLWYENSPLIIHEAAAAQVPVIATDLGGMAEYVHEGENGLLFRRGDAGHLRQRILELAGVPERLSRLRRPPFPVKSIAENAGEFERLYQRLLGRSATSRAAGD
jgi:glycosyltransferase involved in cell wall biosynthesis